ncbi:hypothetical protein W911_13765 [Hyphomicrobium nitrativorans NL23]|uniref:Uncharacterized protein n=1 Tax=Hyphomicrobium nitrativorans NL23 TaxID=1029756 RepID=V5SJQ2_9HYPH|nr:hypothetical protein [Hyphomicrobium nitrativorans]AHB50300.1 hypothetical protein W911_13765 [Hyphomicrobium nitrativorans NL23]
MTRIFLAIATALLASATLFGTPAEACISCEYTPEVVNTPNPNARGKQPRRHQAKQKQRSPAKSQAARKAQPAKAKAQQVKAAPAPAPAPEIAKAEPEPAVVEAAPETQAEKVETGPRLTGSSALMQHSIPREEEPEPVAAAEAEHLCKKFVPAIGSTVSVPCE